MNLPPCPTPWADHVVDSAVTTRLFIRYTDGCQQTWPAMVRGDAPRPFVAITAQP